MKLIFTFEGNQYSLRELVQGEKQNQTSMNNIKDIFEDYKNLVFTTKTELKFWKSVTELSITKHIEEYGKEKLMYEALFAVNNLNYNSANGKLNIHPGTISITSNDLTERRKDLFNWILNLSLLRIYNGLEIFILRAIHLKYFSELDDPLSAQKVILELEKKIKQDILNLSEKYNTRNNKYLHTFLSLKSDKFCEFSKQSITTDLTTDWENFFELISILRNVVVHNGMILTRDAENEIKSKANVIFQRHFELKGKLGMKILCPNESKIEDFINIINDFALNTVKFIFEEEDLYFLGFETPNL